MFDVQDCFSHVIRFLGCGAIGLVLFGPGCVAGMCIF